MPCLDGDSKIYKTSVRVAEELIGGTQIAMLKVSLAMHSMSPRVQAHFQIASEVIAHGDCNTKTFVTIGNKVACNLNELKKGIKKVCLIFCFIRLVNKIFWNSFNRLKQVMKKFIALIMFIQEQKIIQ